MQVLLIFFYYPNLIHKNMCLVPEMLLMILGSGCAVVGNYLTNPSTMQMEKEEGVLPLLSLCLELNDDLGISMFLDDSEMPMVVPYLFIIAGTSFF